MGATFSRIIVHLPNWIGDTVMATPVFRQLRVDYPEARRVGIGRKSVLPILDGSPWFDETWPIPTPDGIGRLSVPFEQASRIRKGRFDLGLLLPNSFRSALMFWLGGVHTRVGYARDARKWMLTHSRQRPSDRGRFKPVYMADYYLALLEQIGSTVTDRRLQLYVPDTAREQVEAMLSRHGINADETFFLLCPGAAFGPSKLWAPERFAALADALVKRHGGRAVCAAAKADGQIVARIVHTANTPVIDMAAEGADLNHLKELARRCRLMVTLDSGPRHFAVAFETPVVTLLGPTNPDYARSPYEIGAEVRVDLPCSPCQEKVCPQNHHKCMAGITVEMVLEACENSLGAQESPLASNQHS